jgi:hypothetical protein
MFSNITVHDAQQAGLGRARIDSIQLPRLDQHVPVINIVVAGIRKYHRIRTGPSRGQDCIHAILQVIAVVHPTAVEGLARHRAEAKVYLSVANEGDLLAGKSVRIGATAGNIAQAFSPDPDPAARHCVSVRAGLAGPIRPVQRRQSW